MALAQLTCLVATLVANAGLTSALYEDQPSVFSHQSTVFHPPTSRASYGLHPGPQVSYPVENNLAASYLGGAAPATSYLGGAPPAAPSCPQPVAGPCHETKYRTIDGSCNNLRYPSWGTPNTRYGRLLPPKYADGLHVPPVSVTGDKLPGSRLVSIVMFPDHPVPDPVWTLASMQWGQIITHDMSMAMGTTQAKAHSTQCCSVDGTLRIPHEEAPKACFPIVIPEDDPVYSKFNQMCMNFVRSTTDVDQGCVPYDHPAEQLVVVTHYMDASLVYGSSQRVADSLREGHGGRLVTEFRGGRPWPPPATNKSSTCDTQEEEEPCYRFGDVRANQNPQLTVLQIVLLREHNRLATVLGHINPHWDDETLYQEARRILIAEYQHINYAEWLPIFIGTQNMLKYGLLYKTDGYTDDYKEEVEPNTINEHATAAFRYFHSAIVGKLQLIGESRHVYGALRLSDFFNRPGIIEQGENMDHLLRGLGTQNQENVDPFITSEITDYLFRNGKPFGRDLRAIDIQRGRDHGLASYNDFRQFCGLPRAHKFEEFTDYISAENVEKLALLYHSPDDVDLVVGGSLETHIKDTLTGPTFLCLFLEQFYRTRVSDRFFYDRGGQHSSFSPAQLHEIRKASFSRLLCDNSDDVKAMQPKGFEVIREKNYVVPCHALPELDLSLWKEEQNYTPYLHAYGKKK